MSFGYSVSDVALLTRLAWTTVKNSRKACGEYDELTQEVSGLHLVLRKLEKEVRDEEEKGKIKDSAKKDEGIMTMSSVSSLVGVKRCSVNWTRSW
jgi:hypothetical protein